ALTLLCTHDWPGNVRELQNILERLTILVDAEVITAEHIKPHLQAGVGVASYDPHVHIDPTLPYREAKDQWERDFLLHALQQNEMNVSKTATSLGIERSHLHKKLKSHQINIVRMND